MGGGDSRQVEQAEASAAMSPRCSRACAAGADDLPGLGGAHVVEPRRAADVAIVEADHVEAPARELLAEVLVPGDHLRAETHDEQHSGVAGVAEGLVAERDVPHVAEALVHRVRH